jgi:hypothetical protein
MSHALEGKDPLALVSAAEGGSRRGNHPWGSRVQRVPRFIRLFMMTREGLGPAPRDELS